MADLIRVDLHKPCYLLLTPAEYARGIARGKAYRRRQAFEKRLAKLHAERSAAKPALDDAGTDTRN
jgi:hypothetical protein